MNFERDPLNEDNFIIYAMKAYDNPSCLSLDEFHDDLKRIKYIKRLLNRYESEGELKDRLIMNHIIVMFNVFNLFATRILFYKLEEEFWPALKTFLVYLGYMPDIIYGIRDEPIITSTIEMREDIIEVLREI